MADETAATPDNGMGRENGSQKSESDREAGLLAEIADLKDRLLRTLAEMENLRRRTEREIADGRQYAVTNFARDMLVVSDNLSRALAAVPPSLAGLFATVVREAVTNVLRHSDARTASIRVVVQGPVTTLSVENDGVRPAVGNDAAGGTGLAALAARAGAVGAELVAGPDGDDRFVVRVSRSAPSGRSR